jgi:hypothetical protein
VRRSWFQDDDGTYYRNCPLIERDRARRINVLLPWRARILAAEWRSTFAEGVTRTDRIGRFDRIATPVPFRDAYPDHPGLWTLDER